MTAAGKTTDDMGGRPQPSMPAAISFSPDFQSLFNAAPGLFLVLSPELRIVAASDMYLSATMTIRDEIVGKMLFDVFPDNPDDPAATGTVNLRRSLERVLANKAPDAMAVQKYDIRRPAAEGGRFEERYWSPLNSPVIGEDGTIAFIIHRVEDVTEFLRLKQHGQRQAELTDELRKRSEQMETEIYLRAQEVQNANQELRKAIEALEAGINQRDAAREEAAALAEELQGMNLELEAANKELDAFAYSVSHDLRAPLRAIDGFSRILQTDFAAELPPAAQELLQDVRDNARQMGQLVDELLSFSRLGRQPLTTETVAPEKLIRVCLTDLGFQQAGQKVCVQVGDLANCQGDPALLKQVWMNLLSNALKYTSQRERAVIEIGCSESETENEVVYFVKDNGVGFDMRYAGKLFGVFQRLHRAEDYEGTGVGLAIVQRIVHRHGGRVWAEAAPDAGATFYFTLPSEGGSHG